MEKQHNFVFNLVIFGVGIILVLLAHILTLQQPSDPEFAKYLRTVGIGMAGYAPLRLLIYGYERAVDHRKSQAIAKLFSSSVRVVHPPKDLPALLASDVEGCITPPDRAEIDLVKFARLRRYCEFAKTHRGYPPLIFFTGRSQGYVELLAQSFGILASPLDLPFVIENGAALYQPTAKKTVPLIKRDQVLTMLDVRRYLEEKFPDNEFEPKSYMVTLNPEPRETVDELREKVTLELQQKGLLDKVAITSTASSVDISPRGVSKLAGLKQAVAYLRIDGAPVSLERVVGFGDQIADLEVLKAVGKAYCPAESHAEVRKFVDQKFGREHVVKLPHIDFVVSVIEKECGLRIV